MTDISFATTTYNETLKDGEGQWLLECLATPIADPRISEIVISDDNSTDYDALVRLVGHLPKVKMFRLPENRGPFGNKLESIRRATGDWVIIGDSDNVISPQYIDMASPHMTDPTRFLCPAFAKTNFDYRSMNGEKFGPGDFYRMSTVRMFWCFVNTGNMAVHRETFVSAMKEFLDQPRFDLLQPDYLNVSWRDTIRHRHVYDSADSFFINKTFLLADPRHRLFVVPDMEYDHRWRRGSTYERGGVEKEMLVPIYHFELLDAANGLKHEWRALGRGHDQNIILQRSSPGSVTGQLVDILHVRHRDYRITKIERRPKQ